MQSKEKKHQPTHHLSICVLIVCKFVQAHSKGIKTHSKSPENFFSVCVYVCCFFIAACWFRWVRCYGFWYRVAKKNSKNWYQSHIKTECLSCAAAATATAIVFIMHKEKKLNFCRWFFFIRFCLSLFILLVLKLILLESKIGMGKKFTTQKKCISVLIAFFALLICRTLVCHCQNDNCFVELIRQEWQKFFFGRIRKLEPYFMNKRRVSELCEPCNRDISCFFSCKFNNHLFRFCTAVCFLRAPTNRFFSNSFSNASPAFTNL